MKTILVIDDEKLIRKSLKVALEEAGFKVLVAETGAKGLSLAKKNGIDLILLDIKLPDINGIDVLKVIKEMDSETIVMMMTGYGTIENAVLAMKEGAFDYINKPFKANNVISLIRCALETNALRNDVRRFVDKDIRNYGLDKIIGDSPAIRHTLEMVKKVAKIDSSTVLIEGESGTGKELIAKAIHYNSSRRLNPFIEINCAAIPQTLLESELFGFEKGSFTDAKNSKKGLVEQADGGSLFLDEIGDMDVAMQAKILNVLQEKKFRRIGGDRLLQVDVRIIAATNHNLRSDVMEKRFREDLFYRLNVVHIRLTPLRERQVDIPPLIHYFIDEFNRNFKKKVKGIAPDALQIMIQYAWPGNVRELRNVIERIMILNNLEIITSDFLPPEIKNPLDRNRLLSLLLDLDLPDEGIDLKEQTRIFQERLIDVALKKAGGNRSKAAALLKLDRFSLRYLRNKIKLQ